MIRTLTVVIGLAVPLIVSNVRAQIPAPRPPIIDMHLHAYSAANWKGAPRNPATDKPGPTSADEHRRLTLAAMAEYNIVKAIVSGPIDVVEEWRTAAPDRVIAWPNFGRPGVDYYGQPLPSMDALGALFKSGKLRAIGEVQAQYEGLSPSDPGLEPYFALAESLDVPVGIHTGTSFPGTPYQGIHVFDCHWVIHCWSRICWCAIPSCASSWRTAPSHGGARRLA